MKRTLTFLILAAFAHSSIAAIRLGPDDARAEPMFAQGPEPPEPPKPPKPPEPPKPPKPPKPKKPAHP